MQAIASKIPVPITGCDAGDIPTPEPGAGEVLIKVAAAGLNRADLLQAAGNYPPPPGASETLGMEVSGTVAALGNGVRDLQEGDAVCALLPGGGYAEYALRGRSHACCPCPPSLDLVDAAALPEALFTVWTNLMDTAPAQAGRTRAGAWRLQRHRRDRDPDAGGAGAHESSPPPAATKNARLARRWAPAAPSTTETRISSP